MMDKVRNALGMSASAAGNGGKDGKRGGGWVSPNSGGERPYGSAGGPSRPPPRVTQEQFNELKAAVVQLEMDAKINEDIVYKACQLCPQDNNTAIEYLLSGQIYPMIERFDREQAQNEGSATPTNPPSERLGAEEQSAAGGQVQRHTEPPPNRRDAVGGQGNNRAGDTGAGA